MKSLFLIVALSFCTITIVNAQRAGSGGFRRGGRNAQIKAMQRQKLKDTLGLTDEQSKNVDAVQQDYQLKMRSVKMSTLTTDAEKKVKLKDLQDQRTTDLKEVLTEQQLAKLDNKKPAIKKAIHRKKKYYSTKRKKKLMINKG